MPTPTLNDKYWDSYDSFNNGTYVPDDGYDYNDGTEPCVTQIPVEPPEIISCIGITGPLKVCENKVYTYTVTQQIDHEYYDGDIGGFTVRLSYLAGSLRRGVDFMAPETVYVKEGETSADFKVRLNTRYRLGFKLRIDITLEGE